MFISESESIVDTRLEAIRTPLSIWKANQCNSFSLASANSLFDNVLDKRASHFFSSDIQQVFPSTIANSVSHFLNKCITNNQSNENEITLFIGDQVKWWRFLYSPLVNDYGQIASVLITCIDITDKKQLEISLDTSLRRFEAVINSAYDGIISVDDQFNIKLFNQAAVNMFGYELHEAIGMRLTNLIPARFHHNHDQHMNGFIKSSIVSKPMHTRASVHGVRKDGSEFPIEITISKIKVGNKIELTAVLRDVSERARMMQELTQAATVDPLTGIYNRRYFGQQLALERSRCQRFKHHMSIIMFDLDNFKRINDIQGHNEGDAALISVANHVKQNIRDLDTFARWGGDEFMLILPETKLSNAVIWAQKIRLIIQEQQALEGRPHLTISVGVIASKGRSSADQLLAFVDEKLYAAKSAGKNYVSY